MTYRGDYDPTGFDQANPATWPTATGYEPGDWWYLTAAGTINGIPVDVGDRLYPIGTGRLYGEDTYGGGTYGGAVPPAPWPADSSRVRWTARPWTNSPAWQRPPAPYAGAPFGDTGWRIAVELLTLTDTARLYGSGTYGSGTYGDVDTPPLDWADVACHVAGATIRRGGTDDSPLVAVDQITMELVDPAADVLPITADGFPDPDGIVRTATVDTVVRVALIDPAGDPHPIFTGRVERLEDLADRPPRTVTLEAFGMAADLVTTVTVDRPAESAGDRLAALVAAGGYRWGIDPAPAGPDLRRTDPQTDTDLRGLIDLSALSASWQTRTDSTGVLGWRPWPIEPDPGAAVIAVTDRRNTADLPAIAATLTADTGEILNVARAESVAVQGSPALSAEARGAASIGRYGPRSEALGFPLSGLFAQRAELDALVAAAVARHADTVHRVTAVDVTTEHDRRWLGVLADLAAGAPMDLTLTRPVGTRWSANVVGWEFAILPGRIRALIYLTTTTPTT